MARKKNRRNRQQGALDRLRKAKAAMVVHRETWLRELDPSPDKAEKRFNEIIEQRERDIATLEQRLSLDLGGGRRAKKEDNGASQSETKEG